TICPTHANVLACHGDRGLYAECATGYTEADMRRSLGLVKRGGSGREIIRAGPRGGQTKAITPADPAYGRMPAAATVRDHTFATRIAHDRLICFCDQAVVKPAVTYHQTGGNIWREEIFCHS